MTSLLPLRHFALLTLAVLAWSSPVQANPVATQAFELPGYISTNIILPDLSLSGDLYKVEPSAYCDGLDTFYTVTASDGETYQATGSAQLYQRIAEVGAIAALRKMESDKAFGDTAGKTAGDTITAVGKTVSDPGKFIEGVPKGVSKFFGSLGEALKGDQTEYEGKNYNYFLGGNKAKRQLAVKLGVNPYSTNETLQKELNRVGWSAAGGGMLVNLAVSAIPAGAGLGLNMNRKFNASIVDEDPKQLNIINRKKLLELGLSRETTDLLLKQPYFSPIHRTVITEALSSLGPDHGQDVFLEVAQRASNEVDAIYFQQVAQLIEKYNQDEAKVASIHKTGRTVSFIDANGKWVLPVPFDYCLWTEQIHERAQRIFSKRQPGQTLIVYTTGRLSEMSHAACAHDQVKVIDKVALQ